LLLLSPLPNPLRYDLTEWYTGEIARLRPTIAYLGRRHHELDAELKKLMMPAVVADDQWDA
jgi:hypothetical protein